MSGEVFFIRRGGGGGLSKCSIIVHIDTGSTVNIYSDSGYSTLVEAAKEIGTSGDYVASGLATGTYYIKATKGGKTARKSVTCSVYGVKDVTLSYGILLFDGSTFLSEMGSQKKITNTDNIGHFTIGDGFLDVMQTGGINLTRDIVYSFQSPVSFSGLSKLYVDFESPNTPTECYVGISSNNTTDAFNASASPANDHSRSTANFGLSSYQSGNYYLKFKARAVADQGGQTISRMKVYRVWAE